MLLQLNLGLLQDTTDRLRVPHGSGSHYFVMASICSDLIIISCRDVCW